MRKPNLNGLKMFDAAARHLNFGLAAKELHLTQGAVAQQVRKLEQGLGIKLFVRQARGLALTEFGQSYHPSIAQALQIIDEATNKIQVQQAKVKISVPPSFAAKWLSPRLKNFTDIHQDIIVEIVASESLADFRSDEVDLAIRMGQPPFDIELNAQLLALQKLCAVCSPNYAANKQPILQLGDFTAYDLIHDNHSQWEAVLQSLPQQGLKFNHTALAIDAAIGGQGVALVPYILAETALKAGDLSALWWAEPTGQRVGQYGYFMMSRANVKPSAASQLMMNWLMSEMKNS